MREQQSTRDLLQDIQGFEPPPWSLGPLFTPVESFQSADIIRWKCLVMHKNNTEYVSSAKFEGEALKFRASMTIIGMLSLMFHLVKKQGPFPALEMFSLNPPIDLKKNCLSSKSTSYTLYFHCFCLKIYNTA